MHTRDYVVLSIVWSVDLGRMYHLVSRTEKGMVELRDRFEKHVLTQGIASVERYHEAALSVSHTLSHILIMILILFTIYGYKFLKDINCTNFVDNCKILFH